MSNITEEMDVSINIKQVNIYI